VAADSALRRYYTIHDLPKDSRPRERLAKMGPEALTDAELLAIVLRSGAQGVNVLDMATALMRYYRDLGSLMNASYEELQQHHGVGAAKAAQILAARELGRRYMMANPDERTRVNTPDDVARLLLAELAYADQEHVKVVLIDARSQVIAMPTVYKGMLNHVEIRIGELFKEAVRRNASAIIIAHNHPSGDPTPSPEDVSLTRRIVEAGKLLGIDVLDHLVLGRGAWVSLKEQGVSFPG